VRRRLASLTAASLVIALIVGLMAGSAAAGPTTMQPIGPNQQLLGLVNGRNVDAVVYTVCPGPIYPGRTGPPAGGQNLSVQQVASGGGYTASATTIFAQFNSDPRQVFIFHDYRVADPISVTLRVPCEGTGTATFSVCFDTLPCPAGAQPDIVAVRFIDIAV
jgi:hypothetical protein